jgi:hypothetical protein
LLNASPHFQKKSLASVNYEKKEMLLGYMGEILFVAFSPDAKYFVASNAAGIGQFITV